MFGLFQLRNNRLGWRQSGGNHLLYYNGTHWRIDTMRKEDIMWKRDNGLISNSDTRIFPPTNWSVWNGKKWIPDDKVKIATGDEVTIRHNVNGIHF